MKIAEDGVDNEERTALFSQTDTYELPNFTAEVTPIYVMLIKHPPSKEQITDLSI